MKIESRAGFLISKIHQISGRVFARLLKLHGLTEFNPAQGRILFVLWEQDGIPIRELAKKTGLGKSTLTSMLDRLEDSGFVQRLPSRNDRRQILIWRTDKDREMQGKYEEVSGKINAIVFSGFSEEDRKGFEQNLEKMLNNLNEYETRRKYV